MKEPATPAFPLVGRGFGVVELRGFEPLTSSDGRAASTPRRISVYLCRTRSICSPATDRTNIWRPRYAIVSEHLGELRTSFVLTFWYPSEPSEMAGCSTRVPHRLCRVTCDWGPDVSSMGSVACGRSRPPVRRCSFDSTVLEP
jgi:hypothetical protein